MLQELTMEEMDQVAGGYSIAQAVGTGMIFLAGVGLAAIAAPEAFAAVGFVAGADALGASINMGLVGSALSGGDPFPAYKPA